MDTALILEETKKLLVIDSTNRNPHWLAATLSALETCPLEIPEVIISHTHKVLPYIHARIPQTAEEGKIQLKEAVKTGILDFGCGLAIHLPESGEPDLRLRFGDLVWLQLDNTLNHQINTGFPNWRAPLTKGNTENPLLPRSGQIAKGTTELNKIPDLIFPQSVQDTILGFLHKATGHQMKIGLLTDKIHKTITLALLTGIPIGGEFNPTPILQALCWHSPRHYLWTAIQNHEEDEILN